MNYLILIVGAALALGAVIMNGWAAMQLKDSSLRKILWLLLAFTATRYMTLIVYGDHPNLGQLESLRYFYFASSIGITMTTVLAVWYAVPLYREKLSAACMLLCFLPWQLFYGYVIIGQPTEIVKGEYFGYMLRLVGQFPFYLSIVQGSFTVVILGLIIIGFVKFKHPKIRVQLFFLMAAQLLLSLDGISFGKGGMHVFVPFTVTEAFAFMAAYYTFRNAVKSIGK